MEENTWERLENLKNAGRKIEEFEKGRFEEEIRRIRMKKKKEMKLNSETEEFRRRELPGRYTAKLLYEWDDKKFDEEYLKELEKNWNRWKNNRKEGDVISQTPKHVRDMFNFNTTSNPHGCLVLFVSKTLSVVWYFIMDLIPPKVRGYFALFELKSTVIFICIHCLIISFKLRKFTWILRGVFPSPSLNSYIVFY